jgi:bacterioferritin-associated ferredoxin
MFVCICNALNDRQVDAAAKAGVRTYHDVFSHYGCESQCGRCESEMCSRLDAAAPLVSIGAGKPRGELADAE